MLEGERGFVIDTNVIIGAFFYNSNHPQLKQTYFLALALERGYSLITRDKPMCAHANSLGVHCLLIDESMGEDDIRKFMGV